MIAFYDNSDPTGTNFFSKWANKYIDITGSCNGVTKTFRAVIADTCGNSDCNNCCAKNSNPMTGYLIDMEYYTLMRIFGTTACTDYQKTFSFSIDMNQPPAIKNCGAGLDSCNGKFQCCSADGYCGGTSSFCSTGCQQGYGYCWTPYSCGPSSGKICTGGNCCSAYGYCGAGSDFCGAGCIQGYGTCN